MKNEERMEKQELKQIYKAMCEQIENCTDAIDLKEAIRTARKGSSKIRDQGVFIKEAFATGNSWIGIPREFIFWTSLPSISLAHFNEFLKSIGSPLYIPLSISGVFGISLFVSIFIFGYFAHKKLGLPRRAIELKSKYSPWIFVLFTNMYSIQKEIKNLEKKLEELYERTIDEKSISGNDSKQKEI